VRFLRRSFGYTEHFASFCLETILILCKNPNNVNEKIINIPLNARKTRTFGF